MKEEAAIARIGRIAPELRGRTAVVLGYGKSGRAAAELLVKEGASVRVSDASSLEKLGVEAATVPGGAAWIGAEDPAILKDADLVVVSPGVPPRNPVLAAAQVRGIPIHSELEIGWKMTKGPVIAITGTNGKTTTTELAGAIARAAGWNTIVAGNVGTPLTSFAGQSADLMVVEVSSFQLAFCESFRPEVGLILNLTEDHLDWHADFDDYAKAKRRMFDHQTSDDAACLPAFDVEIARRFAGIPGHLFHFGDDSFAGSGTFVRGNWVVFRKNGRETNIVRIAEWKLAGRHNLENLLAAVLAISIAGVPPAAAAQAVSEFRSMPHRMEIIAESGGVQWINDSKSTNPGSLEKALDPSVPTILIAGGVTKGCDFRPLLEAISRGARLVLVIGEGAAEMEEAWRGATPVVRAGTLENAVEIARREALPGERVLLSPACASFDQFRNYAHRGDRFRELVLKTNANRGGEGS
jgi:UDP-N-acetylmuramoylalanine--D-glutamate ligase